MAAKTGQDATIYQSEDVSLQYTITDSDAASVNLTGASVTWAATPNGPTGTASLTLTSGGGEISIATNVLTVTITDTQSAALSVGSYHQEISATLSGNTAVMATGTLLVKASGTD